MTTLTVLATLAAVPFLFGVVLALALGAFIALYFATHWMWGLRSGSPPPRMTGPSLNASVDLLDRF
jgi:hypothetical protein